MLHILVILYFIITFTMAKAFKPHQPNKYFLCKVGIKIRQLREEKNLTIELLAGLSGISYKYLQEVETAKYSVSVSVLYSITQALGISLCDFFNLLSGDHNASDQNARRSVMAGKF